MRKSKTNEFRERIHKIPVVEVQNRELCTVFWVKRHMELCPAPAGAKAFRMLRLGHSVPLAYNYYTNVLKATCMAAGLFSSHSLRRGGGHLSEDVWGLCGDDEEAR